MVLKRFVILMLFLLVSITPALGQETPQQIREQWESTIGVDVWRPYFIYMELEDLLKEKLSIHLGPFKGRPNYSYSSKWLEYKFTWNF